MHRPRDHRNGACRGRITITQRPETFWAKRLERLKLVLEQQNRGNEFVMIAESGQAASDFRLPNTMKWRSPRAVADGAAGTIIATAQIPGTPDSVFAALTTNEVEKWWGAPNLYSLKDFKADLHVCGQWSVGVCFPDRSFGHHWGEFCEIDAPRKLVMTWRGDTHPLLGARETTVTYRLEPVPEGTRLTVRGDGFAGRAQAAYGNAENWELVLGWLADYMQLRAAKPEAETSEGADNVP